MIEQTIEGLSDEAIADRTLIFKTLNVVSSIIVIAGLYFIFIRFTEGLGAVSNHSDYFPWGVWIGFNLLCGVALSSGGFTATAAVYILGLKKYEHAVRPAILTGFLGYSMVLLALLIDVGMPIRLVYPFFVQHGTSSLLFEVSLCIALYYMVLFLEFSPAAMEVIGLQKVRKLIIRLTIFLTIVGVILSTLHQSSLGALFLIAQSKVHPLWYSKYLPYFFFISSIVAGISMVIIGCGLDLRFFHKKIDVNHLPSYEPLFLGFGKAGALVLAGYFIIKVIDVADIVHLSYLSTAYGKWFLIELLGFVLLPCLLYLIGVARKNVTLIKWTAGWTVFGIIINRLNVSIIAFHWELPMRHRYFPSLKEFGISIFLLAIGMTAYRIIVKFMPILYKYKDTIKKQEDVITSEPISKIILSLAIPAGIGFMFNTLYNIVDTYFAGLISAKALAALQLTFPVFLIIIAVAAGISGGATSIIGSLLGAGKREDAKKFIFQVFTVGLCVSIVLPIAGIYGAPYSLRFMGASGEYLHLSLDYMNPIFWGTILFVVSFIFNSILTALGDTKSFGLCLILGFFLNVLLDPWFIFGGYGMPAFGIEGIAYSTLLIQFLTCIFLSVKVYKTGMISNINLKSAIPESKFLKDLFQQGIPSCFNYLTLTFAIGSVNYFASLFGYKAVAAYGIGLRITQFIILPAIGLEIAVLSIVSQNYGARLFDRIYETLNNALKFSGIFIFCGAFCIIALADPIVSLFSNDESIIRICVTFLKIFSFAMFTDSALFITISLMIGIQQPSFGLSFCLIRRVFIVIALYFAINVYKLGLESIWWCILVYSWIVSIISYLYARHLLNEEVDKEI